MEETYEIKDPRFHSYYKDSRGRHPIPKQIKAVGKWNYMKHLLDENVENNLKDNSIFKKMKTNEALLEKIYKSVNELKSVSPKRSSFIENPETKSNEKEIFNLQSELFKKNKSNQDLILKVNDLEKENKVLKEKLISFEYSSDQTVKRNSRTFPNNSPAKSEEIEKFKFEIKKLNVK